jgi:hypothetical protein
MGISMKLVVVTWRDAVTNGGWHSLDELGYLRPATVKSVGYLVHHDDERLILAHGLSGDGEEQEGLGHTCIPASWVDDVEFV